MTIMPPIPSTQMRTDALLSGSRVGIVPVIQNHRLNITEKGAFCKSPEKWSWRLCLGHEKAVCEPVVLLDTP